MSTPRVVSAPRPWTGLVDVGELTCTVHQQGLAWHVWDGPQTAGYTFLFKCTWNFHQVRPQSPKPDAAPLLKQPNVLEKSTQPGRRTAAWKCPRGFPSSETTVSSGASSSPSPVRGLPCPRGRTQRLRPSPRAPSPRQLTALCLPSLSSRALRLSLSPHLPTLTIRPLLVCVPTVPVPPPPRRIYSGRGWSVGTYGVFLCGPPGPGLSEGRAR